MRLRPAVSPSFPHTGTNTALAKIYAVEIQAASVTVILKSPIIFGSARLTTVWSRRPRKVPKMTVARTIHRVLSFISGILLFIDPDSRRHAVFKLRIETRIVLHFD